MEFIEDGGVCSPVGFRAAGVIAGLKRNKRRDLGLIVSDVPANFAAAFTSNRICASSVEYGRDLARRAEHVRAIVINSGNANACTGRQGTSDTVRMAQQVAECLDLVPDEVFVSSTGRIGVPMPMDKILAGIMTAAEGLHDGASGELAEAIMTTDTVPKHCAARIDIDGTPVTIGGVTKGAGMIAPRLVPSERHATMLAYMTTDAVLDEGVLAQCLDESLDASFNRITIDGDMSTNDTFIVMANGLAENSPIRAGSFEAECFQTAFNKVAGELARQMVMDGEGVTRFVELRIGGARNRAEARKCAEAIANSLLCKTAWFGADPNWGRILAAAGYAGVEVNPQRISLDYNDLPIVRGGMDAGTPEEKQTQAIDQREFSIDLNLGVGDGEFTMWTNDLSYEYVKINADYHT